MTGQGLAYWQAKTLTKTAMADATLAEMAAQPRFAEACAETVRSSLERHGSNPLMARATLDVGRYYYGYCALYLETRGGLTLSSIQQFVTEMGMASPGRATAMLLHMRMIGFIQPDPIQPDRRSKRYIPTPAMRAGFIDAMRKDLLALSIVEPQAREVADRLEEPHIFKTYMATIGEGITAIVRAREPSPPDHFLQRNAGMAILLRILASAGDDDVYPPRGPVQMSVSSLAKEFKVSRTHVLRLLRQAEALGYLRRNAEEQTGVICEPLRQGLIRMHAVTYVGQAIGAYRALTANEFTAETTVAG